MIERNMLLHVAKRVNPLFQGQGDLIFPHK